MFPAWIKPALVRVGILAAACVVLFIGVKIVSGSIKKPADDAPQVTDYGSAKDSAPTKVAPVLTSDNVAKTPDKSSATKAEPTKLLTLYEAVGLFEKTGKGEVVSAERLGNGEKSTFNLDVLGANGKQRFNINATGKVIVEVPLIAKKGPSGKKGMSRERIEREGR